MCYETALNMDLMIFTYSTEHRPQVTRKPKRFMNKIVKVLVEGPSKKTHLNSTENADNPQLIGRTATDYIVVFNGPLSLAGSFAEIKITKTSPLTLFGVLR